MKVPETGSCMGLMLRGSLVGVCDHCPKATGRGSTWASSPRSIHWGGAFRGTPWSCSAPVAPAPQ